MRTLRPLPVVLLVSVLATCAGQPAEPWARPDHTPPTSSDTSYCHEEGRRQSATLYPDRPGNDATNQPRTTDERRFPAEIKFYEQCMTRLGYVRVVAPVR